MRADRREKGFKGREGARPPQEDTRGGRGQRFLPWDAQRKIMDTELFSLERNTARSLAKHYIRRNPVPSPGKELHHERWGAHLVLHLARGHEAGG